MKTRIFEILQYLPFLTVISDKANDYKFKIVLTELLRSILVPLIIGIVSVFATIKVMETKVDKLEIQVNKMCETAYSMNERLVRVETRQEERISREIQNGERRKIK